MTRNSTPRTVYTQIFHKISEDIANGVYQKGDMIPTQNELAEAFGVSRVTVREAIKELCRRGILETIKGRGTFVVKSPQVFGSTERSHGLSSLKKYAGAGMGIGSRLISIEELSADSVVAQIDCQSLNLTVGQQTIAVSIQIPSSSRIFATGSYTVQCEVTSK